MRGCCLRPAILWVLTESCRTPKQLWLFPLLLPFFLIAVLCSDQLSFVS